MRGNQEENTGIIGFIGESNLKKGTIADFLSKLQEDTPNISNREKKGKVVYTYGSVFPNEEVAQKVMEYLDRENKRKVCEALGVVITNIEDISWNQVIELIEGKKNEQRPKLLEKIRGKREMLWKIKR